MLFLHDAGRGKEVTSYFGQELRQGHDQGFYQLRNAHILRLPFELWSLAGVEVNIILITTNCIVPLISSCGCIREKTLGYERCKGRKQGPERTMGFTQNNRDATQTGWVK